jgi:hypothetical protein
MLYFKKLKDEAQQRPTWQSLELSVGLDCDCCCHLPNPHLQVQNLGAQHPTSPGVATLGDLNPPLNSRFCLAGPAEES